MKYTEQEMIEFALHFGMALIDARAEDLPFPWLNEYEQNDFKYESLMDYIF